MTSSDDRPTTAVPVVGSGRVLAARYELAPILVPFATTTASALAASVGKKKGKSAVPRIQALADLVDSLATDRQVSPAAATALRTAVEQLLRVVDPPG